MACISWFAAAISSCETELVLGTIRVNILCLDEHTGCINILTSLANRWCSNECLHCIKVMLVVLQMNSSGAPPPPPPPMPPPPEHMDPSEARPFLDPYGRAKTVRIGKWRWPPPKTEHEEGSDSFLQFKLRQHQRKTTPQQNLHAQVCFILDPYPHCCI